MLVLERHERDAFGAARPLARDDETRGAHVRAVRQRAQLRGIDETAGSERVAQHRHRVTPQRETRVRVVGDDVLAFARRAQQRNAFGDAHLRQDRQAAFEAGHLPRRAVTVPAETRQRACRRQTSHRTTIEAGLLRQLLRALEHGALPARARIDQPLPRLLRQSLRQAQAEPQRGTGRIRRRGAPACSPNRSCARRSGAPRRRGAVRPARSATAHRSPSAGC